MEIIILIDLFEIYPPRISINLLTNEPQCEKEHIDISDTAKFQSSGPNTGEMADI